MSTRQKILVANYNLRLTRDEERHLKALAKAEDRDRANYLRMLIHQFWEELPMDQKMRLLKEIDGEGR